MVLAGCQSIPKNPDLHPKESSKEILTAVGQVADALAGQELTEDQKKKFTRDIQKDKDAQSALRSIAGAMDAKKAVVKYCPLDGKRYSVDLQMCPVHHVKLEELVD
jgi:hypothetical protein